MMSEELESELERLKREKVVSEETAQIYLSEFKKQHKQDDGVDSPQK